MPTQFTVEGAELSCPACGHVFSGRVRILADAGLEPRLAAPEAARRLNRLTCPACGTEHMAQVPLLYHNPARALALAYVPAALSEQADDLATGLLARLLQAGGNEDPGDYLLAPRTCFSPEEFAVAVAVGAPPPAAEAGETSYHPNLREALRWAADARLDLVVATLEAIAPVTGPERLIDTLNEQPTLLEPFTFSALESAAERAEHDVQPAVAELLHDVLAMLVLQVPDETDDPNLPEDLPEVVEELLAGADIEAASEYLEPPQRDMALRAALEMERIEQREGTHEHARLFGEILDQMLQPATPDDLTIETAPPERRTNPSELSSEAVEALLAAPTIDEAAEVLERFPELLTEQAANTMQRLAREAEAAGEEALASQMLALVSIIVVAIDDEEDGL